MSPLPLLTLAGLLLAGCETADATYALVDDGYPAVPDGGDASAEVSVFKVWWSVALLDDPVAPGQEGPEHRVVTANDTAYALLAPGWDPSMAAPPTTFIPVRSNAKLYVARGDTLHILVNPGTMTGDCAAGKPLTQEDADFITSRIFPGEFANVRYDAATCTASPGMEGGASDAAP